MSVILTFFISIPSMAYFQSQDFKQNQWQLWSGVNHFSATSNFTREGGQFDRLPSGNQYQLTQIDFGVNYGFSKWSRIRFIGQSASAMSEDSVAQRNNSGFTYVGAAMDFKMLDYNGFQIVPSVTYLAPVTNISAASDDVFISEGVSELQLNTMMLWDAGTFEPFGSLGFNYRDGGRASLLTYAAGAEVDFAKFKAGAGIQGYNTVIADEFSKTPSVREASASKNGGALRFYTVDPALLESQYWIRFGTKSNWSLQLGGGFSVTGAATAGGWNAFGLISFSIDSKKIESINKTEVEKFEEITEDGVDQNAFQHPATPTTTTIPPNTSAPMPDDANIVENRGRSQLKEKREKAPPSDNSNASQLQDAEMHMELRLKKKTKKRQK